MTLPPGPEYLLLLMPYLVLPSAAVYFLWRVAKVVFGYEAPKWLIILTTIFAKPILFFLDRYYQNLQNKRNAFANGAILPPSIQESMPSVIKKLMNSIQTGYPGDVMQEWTEEYGEIVRFDVLTSSNIITSDPEHVKAMLGTQFRSFEKGTISRKIMNSLFGGGIFNTDGDLWKFHRSLVRPFFTRERITDFEIYERNCRLSLKQAKTRLAEGYPINFQDLTSRFTLDSASEFLFGTNLDSLSAGTPYPPKSSGENAASFYDHPSNTFADATMNGQVLSAVRFSSGADWPLGADFWQDQVAVLRKVMDTFTKPLLEAVLAKRENSLTEKKEKDEGEDTTLLEHLVNQTQDHKIVQDELINLLGAARDTTMSLLTFSFYMMVEHPDMEKRLRQEVFDNVGESGNPTYAQMREMKYMKAFLTEVLRLYPPVPINTRTNKEAVILANSDPSQKPFYIPAGVRFCYPIVNIQRRTDLWGPDALEFDPDRFLDYRLNKYYTPNPQIFLAFSSGPRICPGQELAYNEATFFLTKLLQQFTGFKLDDKLNVQPPDAWKTCHGRKAIEKIHILSHLSTYVKGGLWVTMRELNEA